MVSCSCVRARLDWVNSDVLVPTSVLEVDGHARCLLGAHTHFKWVFSVRARLDAVDFDVLVHTNVLEVGGYADEPPLEQRAAAQAHLFRQLYDPDRQRAVINIDGAPHAGLHKLSPTFIES